MWMVLSLTRGKDVKDRPTVYLMPLDKEVKQEQWYVPAPNTCMLRLGIMFAVLRVSHEVFKGNEGLLSSLLIVDLFKPQEEQDLAAHVALMKQKVAAAEVEASEAEVSPEVACTPSERKSGRAQAADQQRLANEKNALGRLSCISL